MQTLSDWIGYASVAVIITSGVGVLVFILARRALRKDLKEPLQLASLKIIRWQTWLKLLFLCLGAAFFLYQALTA